jgi:hypothetical protein
MNEPWIQNALSCLPIHTHLFNTVFQTSSGVVAFNFRAAPSIINITFHNIEEVVMKAEEISDGVRPARQYLMCGKFFETDPLQPLGTLE